METLKFLFDAIVWLVIGFYIGRTFGKRHNLDFARVIAILPDSVVKTLRKAGFKLRAGQFSNEEELREAVDQASQHGLVEEVRKLLPFRDCNSVRTVGYKELVAYFDGQCTLDEAIELIKQNSRLYAKRQVTWLKRYDDALWIQADSSENMKKNLLEHLNKSLV